MTETLRYWIEQSEHECDKPLPIGSCLACDLLQLERELATVTEQRDNAIEMGNRTRDNSGAIIASQVVENIMLTQQRDRLAEAVNAATILIAAKGRHNTTLAYNGLRDALQSLTNNKS